MAVQCPQCGAEMDGMAGVTYTCTNCGYHGTMKEKRSILSSIADSLRRLLGRE